MSCFLDNVELKQKLGNDKYFLSQLDLHYMPSPCVYFWTMKLINVDDN